MVPAQAGGFAAKQQRYTRSTAAAKPESAFMSNL